MRCERAVLIEAAHMFIRTTWHRFLHAWRRRGQLYLARPRPGTRNWLPLLKLETALLNVVKETDAEDDDEEGNDHHYTETDAGL